MTSSSSLHSGSVAAWTDRGRLSATYENRFGASGGFRRDLGPPPQDNSPRKKPGVSTFTNPKNPFCRTSGKKQSPLEEARVDVKRAGARSRQANVLPFEAPERGAPSSRGEEGGEQRTVAFTFCRDHRPGKASCTPRGDTSQGVTEALGGGGAGTRRIEGPLANYLNDMKKTNRARRPGCAVPSEFVQRMNATQIMLPTDIGEGTGTAPGCGTRRRATSEDIHGSRRRSISEQSIREDCYGLGPRKRQASVSCNGTPRASVSCSTSSFLHHEERKAPTTPRTSSRQRKAGERFDEVVLHMKETHQWCKEQSESTKAKIYGHDGFMYSEQVIKYPV